MNNYIFEYIDKADRRMKEYRTNQQLNAVNAQAAFGMYCRKRRIVAKVLHLYRVENKSRILLF